MILDTEIFTKELELLKSSVREAYSGFGRFGDVREKSNFDLVTDADLKIEKYITEKIRGLFPDDRILSEEDSPQTTVMGRTWTIDPIDGTVNMANSIRIFGVQCSLFEGGEPAVGVIYLPVWDELYTAVRGRGAFRNGEPIGASRRGPEKAIVSFGDFSHTRADDLTDELRMMFYLSPKVSKIRMFGCAAADFAALACGKIDGTVLFTKNQWDLAPGILLSREAGCVIRSPEGGYTLDSRAVIAASTPELAEMIRESF